MKVKHYDENGKKSLEALIETLDHKIKEAKSFGGCNSCSIKKNKQEVDKLKKWAKDGKRVIEVRVSFPLVDDGGY